MRLVAQIIGTVTRFSDHGDPLGYAYRGIVRDMDDPQGPLPVLCPHRHKNESLARKCAEKLLQKLTQD